MFTRDNINSNFQKYHNYYLTNGYTQPAASQAKTPAQTPTPKQTRIMVKENNERATILKNVDDPAAKTAMSGGALYIISLLLNKFSEIAGGALMRGNEFTSEENVRAIENNMLPKELKSVLDIEYLDKNNVSAFADKITSKVGGNNAFKYDLKNALQPVVNGQNAFYIDSYKVAVAPKSKPSLMLHELGHALNSFKAKNPIIKFLRSPKIRAVATYAPTALLILDGLFKPQNSEKQGWIERNAGKLGFLAFAPTLVEEAAASIRGIAAAKDFKKELVKKGCETIKDKSKFNLGVLKKNYILAFSTYLLSAIGLGIASKMAFAENKTSKQG